MSRKEKLPPELTAFEAELASLRPDTGSLDMCRLMFLAGQESASKPPRCWTTLAWPTAFTVMTATAAVLLVMLVNRPQPEVVERVVQVEVPVQQIASQTTPSVLPEHGPDAETPESSAVEFALAPAAKSQNILPASLNTKIGLLAAVFHKHNRKLDKSACDCHQLSYRELREQILAKGIESWPVSESGRTQSKHTDPISRLDWTKALLANEG